MSDGWHFERKTLVLHHVYAASRGGERCELNDVIRDDLKLTMDAKVISLARELEHCWEDLFDEEDDSPRFHIRKELKNSKKRCRHPFRALRPANWTVSG
jgi:hypothetical protein